MSPGDLVQSLCFLDLNTSGKPEDPSWPVDGVPMGSIGIIISPPRNGWAQWAVNGQVGWSSAAHMRRVFDEAG